MSEAQEPWKDASNLHELYHGEDMKQSEMADYWADEGYEVSASNISYWMGKLGVNTTHTKHESKNEQKQEEIDGPEFCRRCEDNRTPNGEATRNELCDECIDAIRYGGETLTI